MATSYVLNIGITACCVKGIKAKNYVGFEGRAQRVEYWYFTLINLIAGLILSYVSPTLQAVYALAVFLPALAVRRLHDTERSGWWLLLIFLPLIGAIVLIIFLVQDSTPGDNAYGPNPKGELDPLLEGEAD